MHIDLTAFFPGFPARRHFLATLLALTVPLTDAAAQDTLPAPAASPAITRHSGPWGDLVQIPIFLEAPASLVDNYPLPNVIPRWSFPEEEAPRIMSLLSSSGLSPALLDHLSQPAAQVHEGGLIHLFPPAQEVLELSPEIRTGLYPELGKYPANEYHQDPVLILTDTVEEWFRTSGLRPEIVQQIARLSYRRGDAWALSDLGLVINLANNETEARTIFQSFTRTRTYLLKLIVSPEMDTAAIRYYWTLGDRSFRRKALEPLLNSLKETGEEIVLDIVHLIPPLPRKLLYNYPGDSHVAQGLLPDCHWTSLNFFHYEPHPYLLDARLATNRVMDDYIPIIPPYQYGDILFFLSNADGNAFHSCVFLANNLVFTKNGRSPLAPWIVCTLEDVSRVYLSMTDGRVQAYRRKDGFRNTTN